MNINDRMINITCQENSNQMMTDQLKLSSDYEELKCFLGSQERDNHDENFFSSAEGDIVALFLGDFNSAKAAYAGIIDMSVFKYKGQAQAWASACHPPRSPWHYFFYHIKFSQISKWDAFNQIIAGLTNNDQPFKAVLIQELKAIFQSSCNFHEITQKAIELATQKNIDLEEYCFIHFNPDNQSNTNNVYLNYLNLKIDHDQPKRIISSINQQNFYDFTSLNCFPNEVIRMFFTHLSTLQRRAIARVCTIWKHLSLSFPKYSFLKSQGDDLIFYNKPTRRKLSECIVTINNGKIVLNTKRGQNYSSEVFKEALQKLHPRSMDSTLELQFESISGEENQEIIISKGKISELLRENFADSVSFFHNNFFSSGEFLSLLKINELNAIVLCVQEIADLLNDEKRLVREKKDYNAEFNTQNKVTDRLNCIQIHDNLFGLNFNNLTNIVKIKLNYIALSKSELSKLKECKTLKKLNIKHCDMALEDFKDFLKNNKNLMSLKMSWDFKKMEYVKALDESLSENDSLKQLAVGETPFENIISLLNGIADNKTLERLSFIYCESLNRDQLQQIQKLAMGREIELQSAFYADKCTGGRT